MTTATEATTGTQALTSAAVLIPHDLIRVSKTNPRKHFDPAQLQELEESIRQHGVLQPILVRPTADGAYELVAGERRYRASRGAAEAPGSNTLTTIPAVVREMTDREALEFQVVENLQRADLHPMEEAEGYEQLRKIHGDSVDDLAVKVGKSKAYVYGRMKLLALPKKARKLFYEGRLSASVALLVARIPDAELAEKAAAEIVGHEGAHGADPMSYARAKDHIEHNFMLRLSEASFPRGDAGLLPKAGPCTTCPKRTGNQPELFGDVKSADVCTDPKCFHAKEEAGWKARVKLAEASWQKVLSAAETKKVFPHSWSHDPYGGQYRSLDAAATDAGEYQKTYRQVLKKHVPETILARNPHTGKVHELVTASALAAALKQAGIKKQSSGGDESWKKREKAEKAKRLLNAQIHQAKVNAVLVAAGKKCEFPLPILRAFVNYQLVCGREGTDRLCKAHGWEMKKKEAWNRKVADFVPYTDGLNVDTLIAVLIELELRAEPCSPDLMAAAVEAFKVDVKAIEAKIRAEHKKAQAAKRKKAGKSGAKTSPAKGRKSKPAAAEPGTCSECGCTESTPCINDYGETCAWANKEQTLCSECEQV